MTVLITTGYGLGDYGTGIYGGGTPPEPWTPPPTWPLPSRPARLVVDGAGVARAVVNGLPGLTGKGNPLANGVHLGKARSNHTGAIATAEEIPPRQTTDISDECRISFTLFAVGSEAGARRVAERASREMLNHLLSPTTWPRIVTMHDDSRVLVLWAHSPEGPTFSGDLGGEIAYRVDITFRCQPIED